MNEEREREELRKLKLETSKLEKEIEVLQRRPIFHPSAYIPLIVSMIGLLGASIKLTSTTSERNEARNEAQAAQTGLASAIAQSSPGQLQIVNIKFRGSLTRDVITGLQQKFNSSGIVSPQGLSHR
jgi:hypothetical protein